MSGQQPNAWQTARPRHSQSASRTPQNRSGTASPSQTNIPPQPPRSSQNTSQPPAVNAWAQRNSQSRERQQATTSNGSSRPESVSGQAQPDEQYAPINGFNSADVKAFLSRQAQGAPAAYKPAEAATGGRGSGGAWGSKPNHMANNQPFFVQLAKQVATLEGGG